MFFGSAEEQWWNDPKQKHKPHQEEGDVKKEEKEEK